MHHTQPYRIYRRQYQYAHEMLLLAHYTRRRYVRHTLALSSRVARCQE